MPIILVSTLTSCGTGLLDGRPDEGMIEYALSFPGSSPDGIMSGMLPEKTTLVFNAHHQMAELSAAMGLFRTAMVMDARTHTMDHQLSLMGKRLKTHLHAGDIHDYFSDGGQPTIVHTQRIDTIAGYPCRHAIAVFPKLDRDEVDLWYTDAIDIENPNWMTPFAEVKGVLLRYEIVQHGLRMRMDATTVKAGKVDPHLFEQAGDHQEVSPDVMRQEMAEVIGSFTM